jgi:putative addiction module killer protein
MRSGAMQVDKTEEFAAWIDALRDRAGRARILVRVERLIAGHPGAHRHLGGGVCELKIDAGPGYRVYYAQFGSRLLLLLAGGDKRSQNRDIVLAMALARAHGSSTRPRIVS